MARWAQAQGGHRSSARALSLLVSLLALIGCARAAPEVRRVQVPRARPRLCCWGKLPIRTWSDLPFSDPQWGARITRVSIRGAERVPPALVRSVITSRPGAPLERARVRRDVEAIDALEVFSDVRAETSVDGEGLALSYVVVERPLIGRIVYQGVSSDLKRALGLHSGDLYDPQRLRRRARLARQSLVDRGHLLARIRVLGCRDSTSRVALLVRADEGPEFIVDRVVFKGANHVSQQALTAQIRKANGPDAAVNLPGKHYRSEAVPREVLFLDVFYYDRGMIDVRIDEPSVHLDRARDAVTLVFEVREGPTFHLRHLRFSGDLVASAARYRALLGLRPGERFERKRLLDGIERIRKLQRAHGRSDPDIQPETRIDRERRAIDLTVVLKRR